MLATMEIDESTATDVMALRKATGMPLMDAKRFMHEQPRELILRIMQAAKNQVAGESLRDPIEHDPVHGEVVAQVLDEVAKRSETELGTDRVMGRCHWVWVRAKELLRKKYGLLWYSPAEMNPTTSFD